MSWLAAAAMITSAATLPEGWAVPVGLAFGALMLTAGLAPVLHDIRRPPRWLVPGWYQQLLDEHDPQSRSGRHPLLLITAGSALGLALVLAHYDFTVWLWLPLAPIGTAATVTYVFRD